jgi:hypothetical protein
MDRFTMYGEVAEFGEQKVAVDFVLVETAEV